MNAKAENKRIVKGDVLVQRLDDELVILNLKDERYFSLDKYGAKFWEAIEEHEEIEKVQEALAEKFDVSNEKLTSDLSEFIQQLLSHGLVREEKTQ